MADKKKVAALVKDNTAEQLAEQLIAEQEAKQAELAAHAATKESLGAEIAEKDKQIRGLVEQVKQAPSLGAGAVVKDSAGNEYTHTRPHVKFKDVRYDNKELQAKPEIVDELVKINYGFFKKAKKAAEPAKKDEKKK